MTDAELTELDLAVARVLGLHVPTKGNVHSPFTVGAEVRVFSPTRNWSDCGPLVERFNLTLHAPHKAGADWGAVPMDGKESATVGLGPTPQVAICRAIVASGG